MHIYIEQVSTNVEEHTTRNKFPHHKLTCSGTHNLKHMSLHKLTCRLNIISIGKQGVQARAKITGRQTDRVT